MAIQCSNCSYLFPKDWSAGQTCPFCGGLLFSGTSSEESLLRQGYQRAPLPSGSVRKASGPIEDLRRSYYSEHTSRGGAPEPEPAPPPVQNQSGGASGGPADNRDYFSRFADSAPPVIPSVSPAPNPDPAGSSPVPVYREAPIRQDRPHIFSPGHLPWWTIFRVLLLIAVICGVLALIHALPALLGSLLNLILALFEPVMVIVLTIFGIWLMIRHI